jgi:hypothetical protein
MIINDPPTFQSIADRWSREPGAPAHDEILTALVQTLWRNELPEGAVGIDFRRMITVLDPKAVDVPKMPEFSSMGFEDLARVLIDQLHDIGDPVWQSWDSLVPDETRRRWETEYCTEDEAWERHAGYDQLARFRIDHYGETGRRLITECLRLTLDGLTAWLSAKNAKPWPTFVPMPAGDQSAGGEHIAACVKWLTERRMQRGDEIRKVLWPESRRELGVKLREFDEAFRHVYGHSRGRPLKK